MLNTLTAVLITEYISPYLDRPGNIVCSWDQEN